MVAIGVTSPDFTQSVMTFAMITGIDENEQYQVEGYGPLTFAEAEGIYFPNLVATVERILDKQSGSTSLAQGTERTILVGMEYAGGAGIVGWTAEDSLEELKQLADTAGAEVVAKFLQNVLNLTLHFLLVKARYRNWHYMYSRKILIYVFLMMSFHLRSNVILNKRWVYVS